MATILQSPFFVEIVLPFLLVFAVVFAILQKSKVLGDGKARVDALVALVIGLIVISFGRAIGIILGLTTFLAVAIVVILVFMILVGAVYKEGEFDLPNGVKYFFMAIIFIAVVIAVLVLTGAWDYLVFLFVSGDVVVTNIVFIVLILIAIVAVVYPYGKGGGKG